MNHDELAFFNHQLAAMLRDGIPLEGALKQLCAGMKLGTLRAEISALHDDLARGVPLKDALARRTLPDLYRRMVELGARTNDLPGALTLLADYYQRAGILWSRLKGLMLYPLIVIVVSLCLTLLLSLVFSRFLGGFMTDFSGRAHQTYVLLITVWAPPTLLALLTLTVIVAFSRARWRAWLRWRVPPFREASLAQLASTITLMLRNGTPFADALAMAQTIESNSPAGPALAQWRQLVESGHGKPSSWPAEIRPFPPLFLWLVKQGGEDLTAGFQNAADIYHARASYRIELALYGALPVSILLLAQMILWQVAPLMRWFVVMMNSLGAFGE